jgi:hypothetical protein
MTWNPIETADEEIVVLVFDPKGIQPEFNGLGSREWPVIHSFPARKVDGRWESCLAECDHGVWDDPSHERIEIECNPSHWQPLPAPTTTDGEVP